MVSVFRQKYTIKGKDGKRVRRQSKCWHIDYKPTAPESVSRALRTSKQPPNWREKQSRDRSALLTHTKSIEESRWSSLQKTLTQDLTSRL